MNEKSKFHIMLHLYIYISYEWMRTYKEIDFKGLNVIYM